TDDSVNQVANHVVKRIAGQRGRHFRRGRGDHHQTQAQQAEAAGQHREIDIEAATEQRRGANAQEGQHQDSPPTAWANRRPRSSKFLNMSRLAQAGDNSTASPASASSLQRCTASSRVATRTSGTASHSAAASSSASRPTSTTARQKRATAAFSAEKSAPLPSPPATSTSLPSRSAPRPAMAASAAPTLVALESS